MGGELVRVRVGAPEAISGPLQAQRIHLNECR
jgi:hypothetical protein